MICNWTLYFYAYDMKSTKERYLKDRNIFVKNLTEKLVFYDFYHIFSKYGKIVSAKLEEDEIGLSKGYGYVLYSKDSESERAIETTNRMMLNSKEIFVGKFEMKREKIIAPSTIYVGNIPNVIRNKYLGPD